jgi:mannose-1-phosphate guanylyltransferase / mannose-6-phosphate isomerase
MKNKNIIPIILAGGSGTRLWPVSRASHPKQFSKLLGELTLFQMAALRVTSSDILTFEPPVIVTNDNFRFVVTQQLNAIGLTPGPIILEPSAKDTAAAVLSAILQIKHSRGTEATILVISSDHIISDTEKFHKAVEMGMDYVDKNTILTFGIQPTHAETGYGYLELSKQVQDGPQNLLNFIEKPEFSKAEKMYQSGNFLWNAGIFMFCASDMIKAYECVAPTLYQAVENSIAESHEDLGFTRLAEDSWSDIQGESIDFAIMEKIDNVMVIPYIGEWSDLGGWQAIQNHMSRNENNVAVSEGAFEYYCENSLLRTENSDQALVGIGLRDIIAVSTQDAVLVAHKDRSQEIKHVLTDLNRRGVKQASHLPKDYRPWGWYETLILGERFRVKRIHVYPGASLSLQSHHHRSEHWIVVEGTALVTINDNQQLVTESQSVFIPLGAKHRLTNPGKLDMVLIEVQTGPYLEENDIIRYEDIYNRG